MATNPYKPEMYEGSYKFDSEKLPYFAELSGDKAFFPTMEKAVEYANDYLSFEQDDETEMEDNFGNPDQNMVGRILAVSSETERIERPPDSELTDNVDKNGFDWEDYSYCSSWKMSLLHPQEGRKA